MVVQVTCADVAEQEGDTRVAAKALLAKIEFRQRKALVAKVNERIATLNQTVSEHDATDNRSSERANMEGAATAVQVTAEKNHESRCDNPGLESAKDTASSLDQNKKHYVFKHEVFLLPMPPYIGVNDRRNCECEIPRACTNKGVKEEILSTWHWFQTIWSLS